MSGGVLPHAALAAAAALVPFLLRAQSADVWRDGPWVVQAPLGGNCGSIPLLQVKGPGSIFDLPNGSILAGLEQALPGALAKACPGAREVILVSGRSRRLIKVPESPAPATSAAASPAAPQPPHRETPSVPRAPANTRAEAVPTATPAQPRQPAAASGSPVPVLAVRSELASLSSARKIEDKCEVLLSWLESSKSEGAPAANYRYRASGEMLRVFRDEPMMAVFGLPYDRTENRWRLEQHEKVMSRCLGLSAPSQNPFTGRQANRTLQQYGQQLEQYRQVLDQSFLGQPGPFEPAAVSRYVQQVRNQMAWANQAMASAAAASPVRESFDHLTAQRQAAAGQLSLLSRSDRSQVAEYLARRQSEIAPTLADDWFRDASGAPKTMASAKVLHASQARIAPVLRALDSSARAAWDEKYNRLIESMIAESLQAAMMKLNAVPALLPGVLQLAAWKADFDAGFRELRAVPAVEAAGHEFVQARARVFTGALPSWQQQVASVPVEATAVAAKHRELETLFPAPEDRSSPVFRQYEAPLRAKEDQLRVLIAAKQRQEEETRAASQRQAAPPETPVQAGQNAGTSGTARRQNNAPLTAGSFSASGLSNETTLTSLFLGDFARIGFDRDDLKFVDMFGLYLKAFAQRCSAHLPANKVEMTRQECTTERVTRNGFGVEISRVCVNYITVGTGLYADPELYAAKKKLDVIVAMDTFRHVGRMMTQMTQQNSLAGVTSMVGDALAVANDMDSLVQMNDCGSPGLKRFEQNLLLFALNKQPVPLGGQAAPSPITMPIPGIPFRDQNYTKLVDDLVSEHSKTWVMNRYVSGSVTGVSVSSRDQSGRPLKMGAGYTYQGFNGRSHGTVTLTFTDGLPECLYFFDFPASCRTPNRKVVAAYASGAYQQ